MSDVRYLRKVRVEGGGRGEARGGEARRGKERNGHGIGRSIGRSIDQKRHRTHARTLVSFSIPENDNPHKREEQRQDSAANQQYFPRHSQICGGKKKKQKRIHM